jgi:predicted esterase
MAPTLLCGGHDDPTVPYFNTTASAACFRARGAGLAAPFCMAATRDDFQSVPAR